MKSSGYIVHQRFAMDYLQVFVKNWSIRVLPPGVLPSRVRVTVSMQTGLRVFSQQNDISSEVLHGKRPNALHGMAYLYIGQSGKGWLTFNHIRSVLSAYPSSDWS